MALEILTATLVIVTASYALSTYRILRANEVMAKLMQNQADAFARPYVTISIFTEPDNPIFHLRVANHGRSAATDLRLQMDKSFQYFGQSGDSKDISKFPAFQNEIQSLPPGAELIFALAPGFVVFKNEEESEGLPRQFAVVAEYKYGDKSLREEHRIDLSGYKGAGIPQDPIVQKLKDINQSLQQIVGKMRDNS